MAYVTDHAVLRYLERVKGIDVEGARKELMCGAIDTAARFGCETVVKGDGTRLKLTGDVVSTVLESRKVKKQRVPYDG